MPEVSLCPKPVIAAIDGWCLAGGMQLSARCDIRVATEQSHFGMPEARRSLTPVGTIDTPESFSLKERRCTYCSRAPIR
ncbi:MAG: enoyl-CoA hydratase/isomerase family protein [Dehalococcoidia bacterium]|nr:enoyl-CoA hydratase/isomerase family protein [Dehalococcoidia bacterium]